MARSTLYPRADRSSQWFARSHPGDTMPHPNVIVLHTTEGNSWPTYSGGAVAPNFTYRAGHGIRQHFPVNMSSRALKNAPGGVDTNTLNAVQIEIVGTCARGGPGIFWPRATDSELSGLVDLVAWLADEWPIPLVSTSHPWVPYPASYGLSAPQRMTFREWRAFSGICGHQHVPENDHGDPGDFPIERLLALASPNLAHTTTEGDDDMTPAQMIEALRSDAGQDAIRAAVWDTHTYGARTLEKVLVDGAEAARTAREV